MSIATPIRLASAGLLALSLAWSAGASAQTLPPVPSDPAIIRLQERVDDLDVLVREQTGEIERLRFELQQTRTLVSRLEAQLAGPPPAPAEAPPPAAGAEEPPAPVVAIPADPAAAFAQAQTALQRGDFALAEAGFAGFLEAFPEDPRRPEAHYWNGQALLARDAHAAAGAQFLAVVRNHPQSERATDSLAYLGVALRRAGEQAQACRVFAQLTPRLGRLSLTVRALVERERSLAQCG